MRSRKIRFCCVLLLTAVWIGFIIQRSLQPASASSGESSAVLAVLGLPDTHIFSVLIRKAAHVTEYGILGVLLCEDFRLLGAGPKMLPLGIGLAVAAADEWIQTMVPGRAGRVSDAALDFLGVWAAYLLFRYVGRLHRKRKERAEEKHGRSERA